MSAAESADDQPVDDWLELPIAPESYAISTWGRVYSLRSHQFLTPRHANKGDRRYVVSVYIDKMTRTLSIAHNVLATFEGPPPDRGYTVGFHDDDSENHRLENLFWKPPFSTDRRRSRRSQRRQALLEQRVVINGRWVSLAIPDDQHGTQNGIDYYGCYCELCSTADRTRRGYGSGH